MDAYKPPDSKLIRSGDIEIKPLKAILIGLIFTVILAIMLSSVIMVITALSLGIPITNEGLEKQLAQAPLFLLLDVVVSLLFLYLSGFVAAKYVPTQETKYGLILGIITIILYIAFFMQADAFEQYPQWYILISLSGIMPAIYLGAKKRRKTS